MIDDLDRDLAFIGRFLEGDGFVRVERAPGGFVDFGAEGAFEFVVGFVGAGEVGMADDEGFFVVVGVDEPAGDVIGGVGADLASGGVVNVEAAQNDFVTAIRPTVNGEIGFAEDHEEVARARLLEQFVAHGQVGVHARGQDGQFAVAFGLFAHVRVEGESADDEQVEVHAAQGFFGGLLHLFGADCSEFGTDRDGGATRGSVLFGVFADGVDPDARVGFEAVEFQALFFDGVLDARALEVFEDGLGEVLRVEGVFLEGGGGVVCGEDAVRGEAFDGEGTRDADALFVFVGFVVEEFGIGAAGDGGVDFLLAGAAQVPIFL